MSKYTEVAHKAIEKRSLDEWINNFYSEIETFEIEGMQFKICKRMSVGDSEEMLKTTDDNEQMRIFIKKLCLTPQFTDEQLQRLPVDVIEKIANRIMENNPYFEKKDGK